MRWRIRWARLFQTSAFGVNGNALSLKPSPVPFWLSFAPRFTSVTSRRKQGSRQSLSSGATRLLRAWRLYKTAKGANKDCAANLVRAAKREIKVKKAKQVKKASRGTLARKGKASLVQKDLPARRASAVKQARKVSKEKLGRKAILVREVYPESEVKPASKARRGRPARQGTLDL